MAQIRIENNYSWLQGSADIRQILWRKLRFRAKGSWYNPRVKSRQWDGYTEFFKKETGRFLTGLLPEVKLFLKTIQEPILVDDCRVNLDFSIDQIESNFLGDHITLRDFQVDYCNQAIKKQRGIIPAPTGSGKSLMGVTLLKALKPKTPALFLANSIDLVEQMYDECVRQKVQNVGRFYGEVKEPNYIICSTVQSAHLLGPVLNKYRFVLIDEIHDMVTKTSKQVLMKMVNTGFRIGMSGTPHKFGGTDPVQKFEVKGWVGPLFKSKLTESGMLTVNELQGRDILSESFAQFLTIKEPDLKYEVFLDAMQKGISRNEEFHKIVLDIVSRCEGRTLIIVEYVEHGDRLKELYPDLIWVHGEDDKDTRKEIIAQLKKRKGKIVVAATRGIFNTGIDVFVHNLINAASGQAEHQIIQRIGRGLRRASDKEMLYYYDFLFTNNEYLKKHSEKRLNILKKEKHRVKVFDHSDPVDLEYQKVI